MFGCIHRDLNVLTKTPDVTLGVLIVSVLAIGPTVRGIKSAEDDGFLRAMKILTRLPSEGK
jgi:hypothetical protein